MTTSFDATYRRSALQGATSASTAVVESNRVTSIISVGHCQTRVRSSVRVLSSKKGGVRKRIEDDEKRKGDRGETKAIIYLSSRLSIASIEWLYLGHLKHHKHGHSIEWDPGISPPHIWDPGRSMKRAGGGRRHLHR